MTKEGVDGGENSNETISLDVLFSSPYCWKAEKYCAFIKACHNVIKEKDGDPDIAQFKLTTDQEAVAVDTNLWYPESNWQELLGATHFDLMTTLYFMDKKTKEIRKPKLKNVNNSSVVELLGIIRNKHEHNSLYSDDEKEELAWFRKVDGKWEFDEHLFVQYWITKVSAFGVYLWEKFKNFREKYPTLKEFYPESLEPYASSLNFGLDDFVRHLADACKEQINKGMMCSRYRLGNETDALALEFRCLNTSLLQRILTTSSTAEIQISDHGIIFRWTDEQGNCKIFNHEISSENKRQKCWGSDEQCSYIITNSISQLNSNRIVDIVRDTISERKIVFFANLNNVGGKMLTVEIESFVQCISNCCKLTLIEMPLLWDELAYEARHRILSEGKFRFQHVDISLSALLPEDTHEKANLLSHLCGNVLNQLLTNKTPDVFVKCIPPLAQAIYLERRISKRIEIPLDEILQKSSKTDIFFVWNIELEALQKLVNGNAADANESSIWVFAYDVDSNVIMLRKELHDELNCSGELPITSYEKENIHAIKFIKEDRFEYLESTEGDSVPGEPSDFYKTLVGTVNVNENEFLGNIESNCNANKKLIFIADMPGMGKSFILMKFAIHLVEKFNDRVSLFVPMTDFVTVLKEPPSISPDQIDTNDVVSTLAKLGCSNKFEEGVLHYWLTTGGNENIKFEIFLDGLDEVEIQSRNVAMTALTILQTKVPSVRVWATVRDNMLAVIHESFGCVGLLLEPFTEDEQIDYLERHWLQYWRKSKNDGEEPMSESLRDFAKLCIKVPLSAEETDIAGVPLQCRMIAEINEPKIIAKDFTLEENENYTLIDLYDKMVERKLEVYLKEKNKLSEIKMHHHIANLVRADMERMHVYFAIKLIFSEESANKFASLLNISVENIEEMYATVLELGIIQKMQPLTFIHRTFAEFFIARFVFKVLNNEFPSVDQNSVEFKNFLLEEVLDCSVTLKVTGTTVCYGLDVRDYVSDLKYPTVCHFLNAMLAEKFLNVSPEFQSLLVETVNQTYRKAKKVPMFGALSKMEFVNIYPLAMRCLIEMNGLLGMSLQCGRYALCKYLMENDTAFDAQRLHIQLENDKKYGLLHFFVKGVRLKLNDCHTPVSEIWEVKSFIRYAVAKCPLLLEQRDAKGRTPLLLLLHISWGVEVTHDESFSDCDLGESGDESPSNKTVQVPEAEATLNGVDSIISIIRFFVSDLKANVNVRDVNGNSVLHVTDKKYLHYVNDDDLVYSRGPRFMYSFAHEWQEVLPIFMENGCNEKTINSFNCEGQTALVSALCYFGETESGGIAEEFKRHGADLNIKNENGSTALHLLIERKIAFKIIKEFIEAGGDTSARNSKGQSALHLAVEKMQENNFRLLIEEFRANFNACDYDGKSVFEYETSESIREYLSERKLLAEVVDEIVQKVVLQCTE